jgi:hypothetical protein
MPTMPRSRQYPHIGRYEGLYSHVAGPGSEVGNGRASAG